MTFPNPFPWQAEAMRAWRTLYGLFAGQPVGSGKTWVAAKICAEEPQARRVIVAPASALGQTEAMFRAYGVPAVILSSKNRHDPQPGNPVRLLSYTLLDSKDWRDFWDEFKPDIVGLDEAHQWRNVSGRSGAKRFSRAAAMRPQIRIAVFSGSVLESSLGDCAHVADWALRSKSPFPRRPNDIRRLDERFAGTDAGAKEARRRFYVEKLSNWPGVFLDDTASYSGPLEFRVHPLPPVRSLDPSWVLPDGTFLVGPAQAAAAEGQLSWGFYTRRTPRPPEFLLEAESEWSRIVRRAIANGIGDTDLEVRAALPEQWDAYQAAKDRDGGRKYATETMWEDKSGLSRVRKFLGPTQQGNRPTIIWAHHEGLQWALADLYDTPLFRAGGRDVRMGTGRLEDCRAQVVVCSIDSCHAAFNCQHFSHNVLCEVPGKAWKWRQLLGRTARHGQLAQKVTFDVLMTCEASWSRLRSSLQGAEMQEDLLAQSHPMMQLRDCVYGTKQEL